MPLNDTSLLAFKLETPPGTWATPTVAADADIVFDYTLTPLENETVYRSVEAGFAGAKPSIPTKTRSRHEYNMELVGGGLAAGTTPPRWMRHLQACLFAAPTTLADRVTQAPSNSGDGGSGSVLGFKDDLLGRGYGARGNAVLTLPEGGLPFWRFALMSQIHLDQELIAEAPGAPLAASTVRPVEVNAASTSVSVDGYVLGMKSLTLDLGNKTEFYTTTKTRQVLFGKSEDGDRRSPTLTLRAELPTLAEKNYFSLVRSGALVAVAVTHGVSAGNIVQLASANYQVEAVSLAPENGKLMIEMRGKLVATAANNELLLTTR